MLLSRNKFFVILFVLFTSPFIVAKLVWLAGSKSTTGKVWFTGHTIQLDGAISSHLVILFMAGKDSVNFEAPDNLALKEGEAVPVRYHEDDPTDARVNHFLRIWGDTIVYGLWPVLVLLILYCIPESLDPVIPRKSKILVSRKKLIEIIKPQST